MDFDNAKENIMPLAGGRNARCLETVLSAESHHEAMVLLQKQREEYENAIHEYEGDDPLEPWFNYIQWIEQSYPSGGKENGLFEVLLKCLTTFESEQKYFQDRRMIKLFIKHIDTQPNPQEYYQLLYNQGVGTMVADLYICWAYYYDLCGNFTKAEEVFRRGLDAKAQPLDELEQAHKHFGFTMSQRILYKDEASNQQFMSSMEERRQALTSLRTHKRKVGSIRTGAAIKDHNPGKVQLSKPTASSSNIPLKVFEDQNHDPNAIKPATQTIPVEDESTSRSVVRSIIDSTRKQENMREPGPWSKARLNDKRKAGLFGEANNHELGFEIMQDENVEYRAPLPKGEDNFSKGIQLPPDFVRKNKPLPKWEVPLYSDAGVVGPNIYPQYEKTHLYPKENEVYCPEEYAAWRWFKKRGKCNEFTQKHEHVWCPNFEYGFHYYPKFCAKNEEQAEFATKRFVQDEDIGPNHVLMFPFKEIYPDDGTEEFHIAEVRSKCLREGKRKVHLNMNETNIMLEDLDETQCVAGGTVRDRRSVLPSRRSIVPKALTTIVESPCQQGSNISPRNCIATGPQMSSTVDDERGAKSVEMRTSNKIVPFFRHHQEEEQLARKDMSEAAGTQTAAEKIRDSEILEDDDSERMPQPMNKFEIYEDTNPGDDCLFKAPQALPHAMTRSAKASKSVVRVQDDPDEGKSAVFPESETTCSTQTFNFFIKGNAISTPKRLRKSQNYLSQLPEQPPQPELASLPADPLEDDGLNATSSNTQYPPKHLSIIMETTETITGSSGAKSSGDTQDSDTESTKSNQTTRVLNMEMCRALNPILEVSSGGKQNLDQPSVLLLNRGEAAMNAIEDTIPAMMASLKIFEDKTETVPKMLLAKPPMDASTNDNFELLFTTTPPKGSMIMNSSAINKSFTFSKLSEITMPKMEEGGKGNSTIPCDVAANIKEQKPVATGTISKKTDNSMLGSFAINNSMTFTDVQNITMPNILESRSTKTVDNIVPAHKTTPEELFVDKSFAGALELSTFANKEGNFDFQKNMPPELLKKCRSNNIPTVGEWDSALMNPLKLNSSVATASKTADLSLLHPLEMNESMLVKEVSGEPSTTAVATLNSGPRPKRSTLNLFSAISRRQEDSANLEIAPLDRIDDNTEEKNVSMKDRSVIWCSEPDSKPIKEEYSVLGQSIYMHSSPKTPELQRHIWLDDYDDESFNSVNNFVHDDIILDHTKQLIEAKFDKNVNPFDPELIKAFLDQLDICSFIETLPECLMVNRVGALAKGRTVQVADKQFDVIKLIGEGTYGSVFSVKDRISGNLYAVKQERPANLWEYYICLELKSRISPNIMFGFMNVEYAVIGNNASLLFTPFSKYGSLINVCHKVYGATGKNVDEYVVMVIASQLLFIIDHLHASNIIHADVKPDNFLLMTKLTYPSKKLSIQMIDFGVSIDLNLFPRKQTFKYVTRTQGFTCIEMLENRPWTYQPDLFGLAGTIHALLFGKYMDVERKGANWDIKTHMPRYFSKTLWNIIFNTLLNIRDCDSMPNLQYLRGLLEEEIVGKEKIVRDKVNEFNAVLD